MGVSLPTIIPNNHFVASCFLSQLLLASSPQWGICSPGDTIKIPLIWKMKLPTGYFELLLPLHKQVNPVAGVTDSEHNREICCLKKCCVLNLPEYYSNQNKIWLRMQTLWEWRFVLFCQVNIRNKLRFWLRAMEMGSR